MSNFHKFNIESVFEYFVAEYLTSKDITAYPAYMLKPMERNDNTFCVVSFGVDDGLNKAGVGIRPKNIAYQGSADIYMAYRVKKDEDVLAHRERVAVVREILERWDETLLPLFPNHFIGFLQTGGADASYNDGVLTTVLSASVVFNINPRSL